MFSFLNKKKRGFNFVSTDKWHSEGIAMYAKLPMRSDDGSAGYDFYCPYDVVVPAGEQVTVWTNIKAYMKKDEVLKVYVRSSVGIKLKLRLANQVGIIDSSYFNNPDNEGNIGVCLVNKSDSDVALFAGDRIAQGIFQKYLVADIDLVVNKQRLGGIGHSGRK